MLVLRILHGAYSDTKVPVGTTEILRNVYMYFRSYTCLTELILVLRNLYGSYGTYTGLTEIILVLRNLYWHYKTDYCLTDLVLV